MAELPLATNGNVNKPFDSKKYKKMAETFGKIDSAMAVLEKLPYFVQDARYGFTIPYYNTPLGYLFQLLHTIGVSDEDIKKWILDILINVLPTIEMGVKASLLSSFKSIISCNADVRIPYQYRKPPKPFNDKVNVNYGIYNAELEARGINIPLQSIDPNGILALSPFTSPGFYKYFGCLSQRDFDRLVTMELGQEGLTVTGDSNARTAKLTRAEDFNAFLWYVIHKSIKQKPMLSTEIKNGGSFTYNGKNYSISMSEKGHYVFTPSDNESDFIAGNTFIDSVNGMLYICYQSIYNEDGNAVANWVIPVSSDIFSCNWYVDKTNYYSKNLGIRKKSQSSRNFLKEKAICNIRYVKPDDGFRTNVTLPDILNLSILPKPYVVLPNLSAVTKNNQELAVKVQPLPIRILFDEEGKPNKLGKYSFNADEVQEVGSDGNLRVYEIHGEQVFKFNIDDSSYEITGSGMNYLTECYPGLTVYEFNYDFIMGMKLFDPKVIFQNIIENSTNSYYNVYNTIKFDKVKDTSRYPYLSNRQKVLEIVRTILEEDEDEIIDCFYSFSNDQYDDMMRKSEEMRYHQMPFNQGYNKGTDINLDAVNDILLEYPNDGTLSEKRYVLERALEQATAILEDREDIVATSDSSTLKIDFLTNVLQQLMLQLVDCILSPKILMLMAVNNAMVHGNTDEKINAQMLMSAMKGVIKSAVREIRDMMIQKLLDYVLEFLSPVALQLQASIASEQFQHYMDLIRLLMRCYNMGLVKAGRLSSVLSSFISLFKKRHGDNIDLPSVIDNITYADIYGGDAKDMEPIIGKC